MKKHNLMFVLVMLLVSKLYSQGCSDAGICSIANLHHGDSTKLKNNAIETGYIFGKGLENVTYNSLFIGYTKNIRKNWGLASRITYNQATGSFGTIGRLGDVFFVMNYKKQFNTNSHIKPSFGLKIPLSTSNFKNNGVPLPLDYQPSLGTLDALFGIDYVYNKWAFDVAFQLPVWQINRNSYFDEYATSSIFPTTNLFKRQPDVLVRTSYSLASRNKKWSFKPNLMAIYHLGNDTYEDVFGKRQEIKNSRGLTVNGSLITDYNITKENTLRLNLAAPFLVRTIRPDGLTRALVVSVSYNYTF